MGYCLLLERKFLRRNKDTSFTNSAKYMGRQRRSGNDAIIQKIQQGKDNAGTAQKEKQEKPMQTENSQPDGKRIITETRLTEFPALSVGPRVGISWSASATDD